MDAREQLVREIEIMEMEIQAKKDALKILNQAVNLRSGDSSLRFYEMMPINAIRILIQEAGRPMSRQEIHDALIAGGNMIGKKRGGNNITFSIDLNLKNGNLIAKGDLIDLPRSSDE
jgi:hypothetical protein